MQAAKKGSYMLLCDATNTGEPDIYVVDIADAPRFMERQLRKNKKKRHYKWVYASAESDSMDGLVKMADYNCKQDCDREIYEIDVATNWLRSRPGKRLEKSMKYLNRINYYVSVVNPPN